MTIVNLIVLSESVQMESVNFGVFTCLLEFVPFSLENISFM